MTRAQLTAATRTPEGARLDLDTGEALQVAPSDWAALVGAPPYALILGDPKRVLDVPAHLLAQVAHVLDLPNPAPDALPLLVAARVEPEHVTLTTREPGVPFTRRLSLPRPLYVNRLPQPLAPDVLTVKLDPQAAQPLACYAVEPYTPEGQAALLALGFAGPYPVPAGVSLGGHMHGATLSEAQALGLAALPDFAGGDWALCPGEAGGAPFTLLWANSATGAQLVRSSTWAELTAQGLRASGSARGEA